MKIIADTSVWIEFLKNNESVFSILKDRLENQEIAAVECVFGELLQGVKNNKEQKIILSYWKSLPKLNETGIWIKAGAFSSENKMSDKGVGLIDCVIIVLAKENNLKIWTLDKKLSNAMKISPGYMSNYTSP
ncbi:MAG: PIN domain-containing protein [Actinomycetota bacterium]